MTPATESELMHISEARSNLFRTFGYAKLKKIASCLAMTCGEGLALKGLWPNTQVLIRYRYFIDSAHKRGSAQGINLINILYVSRISWYERIMVSSNPEFTNSNSEAPFINAERWSG
jgi:hypothetical protein